MCLKKGKFGLALTNNCEMCLNAFTNLLILLLRDEYFGYILSKIFGYFDCLLIVHCCRGTLLSADCIVNDVVNRLRASCECKLDDLPQPQRSGTLIPSAATTGMNLMHSRFLKTRSIHGPDIPICLANKIFA